MYTTITCRSDFHNTECRARTYDGFLSVRQIARINKSLCGHDGCLCPAWYATSPDGRPVQIEYQGVRGVLSGAKAIAL